MPCCFWRSVLLGDVNGDGDVNGLDVDPFVGVLLNPAVRGRCAGVVWSEVGSEARTSSASWHLSAGMDRGT